MSRSVLNTQVVERLCWQLHCSRYLVIKAGTKKNYFYSNGQSYGSFYNTWSWLENMKDMYCCSRKETYQQGSNVQLRYTAFQLATADWKYWLGQSHWKYFGRYSQLKRKNNQIHTLPITIKFSFSTNGYFLLLLLWVKL